MALASLGSPAIRGRLYHDLEQTPDDWVSAIAGEPIASTNASEEHVGAGNVAGLREWIGPRYAKQLKTYTTTIQNKKYEDTLVVLGDEIRRDKTGQVEKRIGELTDRYNNHWAELVSANLELASNPAYDGVTLFSASHIDLGENSGTQSNALTFDAASHTAVLVPEMEKAILASVAAILKIKDNQGKPMRASRKSFVVMVPTDLMFAAAGALNAPILGEGGGTRTNILTVLGGYSFRLVTNPYLTSGVKFYTACADGLSIIRQTEVGLKITSMAEGSEYEHKYDAHEHGIMTSRGVGPGSWQSINVTTFN